MKQEFNVALEKFEAIAPLVNGSLSINDKRIIRKQVLFNTGWSERTLRRYIAAYREGQFEALKPKVRTDRGTMRTISKDVLDYAIQLREDEPQLSVDRIIEVLVCEGKIARDSVARSSLDRHLRRAGKSRKEIKVAQQSTGRRFVRVGRNTLWQSDVKYGPTLTGKDKKKFKTYMIAIIDDATRFICHSEFYLTQSAEALEDCIRKAILKCGAPISLYVDNGKIYRSNQLKLACARLGINLLNTAPYRPEAKGKVEKFNQTMQEFLISSKIEPATDVVEFNARYNIWLDEGYNRRQHSSLAGKTPYEAFHSDSKPIRLATVQTIKKAFRKEDSRKVDKTGCFSVNGVLFEAGQDFCNKRIEIHYDSFDLSSVDIYYNAELKKTVSPTNIGEFCNNKSATIVKKNELKQSRLLNALADKRTDRLKREGLIVFSSSSNGGSDND